MRPLKRPYIIDVEASGFGSQSYPIEIGVALNEGNRFCTLVSPADNWTYWDKDAEKVHRVSREMLDTHGKPVREVAELLNEMLNGMTLYSDGWVVDTQWMTTLFATAGLAMRFSLSPLELLLSEQQMSIWHKTKDQITRQLNLARHRASNDAWIIQETFRHTLAAGSHQEMLV